MSAEPAKTDARSADDLAEAVVSGARWISVARVCAEVVLFASMVVLARLIPPAAFGKFAIVLFVQELSLGVVGGFGNALVQRPSLDREHMQAGFAVVLALNAAIALLTFFVLAPLLFDPIFGSATAHLVRLATPNLVLAGIATVPQATLQRRLDFRRLGQIQIVTVLVSSATSVGLAVLDGFDAEALVFGATAGSLLGAVLSQAFAPVPPPRLHRQALRDLSAYGVPASVAAVSWAGFRNADYAIVGARLGATSAGFYWRAFQLAVEYQKKISLVMYQIAFPVLSRAASEEDMLAIRMRMVRMLTVIIFPLLAGLVALAPVAVPFVFGPQWHAAIVPTQILTVAGAATLVIDAVGATLMAKGRARALLGYGWAHFAVYAVVISLVAPHGIVAVSIAAAGVHLAFLVVAYVLLLQGQSESALRRLWGDVAPALVSSAALLIVAVAITRQLGGTPASLHILIVGAASMPVYLLVLRLAFPAAWGDLAMFGRRVLPARLRRPRRPGWAPAQTSEARSS
jgi:O-antigen/teichoic acid export membrane protein